MSLFFKFELLIFARYKIKCVMFVVFVFEKIILFYMISFVIC